jgi:Dyp-type peroxidase family
MAVREVPAILSMAALDDAAHIPDGAPAIEPPLCVNNIQGNSLAGFNKDHQTLIFFRIDDVPKFRGWLGREVPFVATLAEVLTFNRLFKAVRFRRKAESRAVQSTWLNIVFTAQGLSKLDAAETAKFTDAAFKQGLAARSASLGDPTDPASEGFAGNWAVGGPDDKLDGMLIIAGDDVDDVAAEVRRVEDGIYGRRVAGVASAVDSGLSITYKQHGATLPPPLTGHEHFGWLDGVSQPGVRGTVSDMKDGEHLDLLTLRENPNEPGQGKPGQDCLYPGEFVFGHPAQNPDAEINVPGEMKQGGPSWSDDGSFVVFRRLRQDVGGFHAFLKKQARELGINDLELGSKFVGRWPSGSPVIVDDVHDRPDIGRDDARNNFFEFRAKPKDGTPPKDGSQADPGPSPDPDPNGVLCPFSSHIRKAYPRDDTSPNFFPSLNEPTTQTHRLLRRGIPFGPPFEDDPNDDGERGLVFIAYQTSIENQFEFVTKRWVNDPGFKEPNVGADPILGQATGTDRARTVRITYVDPEGNTTTAPVTIPQDFVVPTGGGYFFSPSIEALCGFAGVPVPPDLHRCTHPPQPATPPPAPPPHYP